MALPNIFAPTSQMEYQRMMSAQTFAEQLEINGIWSTFQLGTATDGLGTGTDRKQAGLIQWLATLGAHRNAGATVDITGTTVPATANSFLHDFGSTPMTVASLNEAIEPARVAGAPITDWTMLVGTKVKMFIDQLMVRNVVDVSTAASTEQLMTRYTRDMDSKMVGQVVDFIQTSWGTLPFAVLKHFNDTFSQAIDLTGSTYDYTVAGEDVMVGLPMGNLEWRILRPLDELSTNASGDNEQHYFVNEEALVITNPADCQIFLHPRGTGS
jgi:hypothetical protein